MAALGLECGSVWASAEHPQIDRARKEATVPPGSRTLRRPPEVGHELDPGPLPAKPVIENSLRSMVMKSSPSSRQSSPPLPPAAVRLFPKTYDPDAGNV